MTNIYYTGHYNEHGTTDLLPAYKIKFHYYTYYGDGLQSDCRLGFIRRQNRLICCIEKLWLQNYADTIYKTFVRHSFFMDGSFFMNRTPFLISIADYAIPEYSYYDQIPSNYGYWCGLEGQDVFSELRLSKTNFSYNNRHYYDIFEADEHIIKDNNSDYKNLNESRNMDWSLGGTLTVGVGPDAWITNISAGGNYDFSKSKGDVDMTLYVLRQVLYLVDDVLHTEVLVDDEHEPLTCYPGNADKAVHQILLFPDRNVGIGFKDVGF